MTAFRRYFLPACISLTMLAVLLSLKGPTAVPARGRSETRPEFVREFFVPHGRALYVIVEEDGVYIGQDFVSFAGLERFLDTAVRPLKPDCALVYGTEPARYGHVANVYLRIRRSLKIETELRTYPVPVGTRRGPIEVYQNHWEYD